MIRSRKLIVASALSVAALALPAGASAAWTTPVNASASGEDAYAAQVGVARDGDSILTWQRSDGTNQRVQAGVVSDTGLLVSVQDLSAAGQDAEAPKVGVDFDGNGLAVWQ